MVQRHPFHVVDPSPWLLVAAFGGLSSIGTLLMHLLLVVPLAVCLLLVVFSGPTLFLPLMPMLTRSYFHFRCDQFYLTRAASATSLVFSCRSGSAATPGRLIRGSYYHVPRRRPLYCAIN